MKIKISTGVLTVIVLSIIGYIAYRIMINYQAKKDIVTEFNKVVVLQHAVENCYIHTQQINQCSSGENGIPPASTDNLGPIEVVNGDIYVAFVGDDINSNLYGSAAQITFDVKLANSGKSPWVCKFQDNVKDKLSASMLPQAANCTMRY